MTYSTGFGETVSPIETQTPAARFEHAEAAAFAEAGLQVSSRFVDVSQLGLRVRLNEVGSGDPVLFIHGGNSVAASWMPLLAPLASEHRLILPDRPGCGLTSQFDYRGIDLRQHGVDFIRSLLDEIGVERAALVGNSMGGYFALAFALAHPERVPKLALLGEPANAEGAPRLFHRLVGTRGLNTLLYKGPLKPAADGAAFRAALTKNKLVADPDRLSDALCECLAAGGRIPGATTSWTSMVERIFVPAGRGLWAQDSLGTHKLTAELAHLDQPTLFLWGDKDPLGSPEVGASLAALMPQARLQVVEDAGHLPWLDKPQVCAAALLKLLA
jgi:pimeloyl-ACP methyl ester carboxylesterase